ncbi:MAG TPA: imidazole glycerol phosphate synthase subunit HisH [Marinobacter hydrocarbonoclasticus]|uniref:Imidazole glycerol phosphate synthase subunit HisH n=1 Tax=Marinobacter nauticus TaxID=2743 RepID=A0A3B8WI78_MARNT|nr:imidazole glycerol phosphate synthase subunit HisH [Marinobacter nauticus]
MKTVAIIDYGMGNLHSARKAVEHVAPDCTVLVTDDAAKIREADRVILPGVGAIRDCMAEMHRLGVVELVKEVSQDRPFLGICVGMQLMADVGEEMGEHAGLGWMRGRVRRLEPGTMDAKVPHMGWNDVALGLHDPASGLIEPGEAYFLHSYHFAPEDGHTVAAMTDHGGGLVAAVARDNVVGVQFHPEKSQVYGLSLLSRFLEWKP